MTMSEDIHTVPPVRVFPTKAERTRRSRDHARVVLLEAGYDPSRIEQEIDQFLAEPLQFELPSFDIAKMMHNGK